MRLFYLLALAVVVALSLSPFVLLEKQQLVTAAPAEGNALGAAASQPAAGGGREPVIVHSSYGAKVRTIDPAYCGDTTSAGIQGNVYEGLYGYHYLKRPVEIIPVLADGMPKISDDGLTYTIRVKKGVRYRRDPCFGRNPDGSPKTRTVTADDFVLAFKRIADSHIVTPMSLAFIEDKLAGLAEYRDRTAGYEKGNFARYDEVPLEGVKALDEHTLQIKLVVPFPQLIYVLAISNYAPIPREVIDYYLARRDDGRGGREEIPVRSRSPRINDYRAAVGTGAYYLSEFVPGGNIILTRNPDFRQEFYPSEGAPGDREAGLLDDANKPVPFVDVNVMQYVAEDNTAWNLFLSKRTDISGIPQQMFHMAIAPGAKLTDEFAKKGIRLVKYGDPAVYWYAFNMEDRVLGKSKSLRQAICLGFNVEQYVEVLFNGRGRRAVNVVPTDFAEHKDLPASPYARYDPDAAREKVAAARKELEAAGVIKPGEDIPELTIDLPGRDEQERRIGEFARIQFKRIGLKLKVELNDWPTLQERVENKLVQIYAMGWHADYPDPENFLQLYYTPNIKRGTNNTNFSNARFDKLYEQASVMLPGPERTKLYAEMVGILNEECPALLLTEPVSFILVHPWVHNVKPHPIGYGMFKYRRIDVEARKAAGGQ